jgi:16S rRNA (adenine(1408)-N(1))-methyltransferase
MTDEAHVLKVGPVRVVLGNATVDVDATTFEALRAEFPGGLVLDIGTGDGKHVLAEARRRPDTLCIGMDAQPNAMRRSAVRAAAKPARGGLPNARFVWAAVEQLPAELTGVTEVHCLMPWGSLLRAVVTADETVLGRVAACAVPNAPFLITLNLHAWRPPVPEVGASTEPSPSSVSSSLAPAFQTAGWQLESADYLDAAQIAELGTSWTKRLGASRTALDVLALRGTLSEL